MLLANKLCDPVEFIKANRLIKPANYPDMDREVLVDFCNFMAASDFPNYEDKKAFDLGQGDALIVGVYRETTTWLLAETIVHIPVHYTMNEVMNNMPYLLEASKTLDELEGANYGFCPDPFNSSDWNYNTPEKFQHRDYVSKPSPIVNLRMNEEQWLASLNRSHRYDVKQALRKNANLEVKITNTLTDEEKDWADVSTREYWWEKYPDEEDFPEVMAYAFPQVWYGWIVANHYKSWFVKVYDGDELLAIASFIRRNDAVYFNSFTRSLRAADISGLGSFALIHATKHFLNNSEGINWLEVTACTEFASANYNIYKLCVCNHHVNRCLMAGTFVDEPAFHPPYFRIDHWVYE